MVIITIRFGGVNVTQIVSEYAEQIIARGPRPGSQYYFDFLQFVLRFSRTLIVQVSKSGSTPEMDDKKSFRLGYIFLTK